MPSFGSTNTGSPELSKMEINHARYGANTNNGGKRFNFGNIAGDPFWLGTIGIAIVSVHTSERR